MKLTKLLVATTCLSLGGAISAAAQADDALKISTKGGLKIENDDGSYFKLGGRLQWDYDVTDSDLIDPASETFEVRRARLYGKGEMGDWGYKLQFNMGEEDGGDVEDLYVTYKGFGKMAKVTIGKHREPFGLQDQTSSNDTPMLERSAGTEAFAPARNGGFSLTGNDGRLHYSAGLFREDVDSESTREVALTGRAAYLLVNDSDLLVHVGGSVRESNESTRFGLEAATVAGPLHAQAEYFDADFDELDEDLDNYYVQVGYVLTGESRPYKGGKFKRIKPQGGTAIEVVARFEDGHGVYSDIGLRNPTDGVSIAEGTQAAIGLNFYPNNIIRFGFSYMTGDIEVDGEEFDGDEFRFRPQLAF